MGCYQYTVLDDIISVRGSGELTYTNEEETPGNFRIIFYSGETVIHDETYTSLPSNIIECPTCITVAYIDGQQDSFVDTNGLFIERKEVPTGYELTIEDSSEAILLDDEYQITNIPVIENCKTCITFVEPNGNQSAVSSGNGLATSIKKESPGFSGGQCPGVDYDFVVRYRLSENSPYIETVIASNNYTPGEISDLKLTLRTDVSGLIEGFPIVEGLSRSGNFILSGKASGNPFSFTFGNTGVFEIARCEFLRVVRADGQPDTCGNPPDVFNTIIKDASSGSVLFDGSFSDLPSTGEACPVCITIPGDSDEIYSYRDENGLAVNITGSNLVVKNSTQATLYNGAYTPGVIEACPTCLQAVDFLGDIVQFEDPDGLELTVTNVVGGLLVNIKDSDGDDLMNEVSLEYPLTACTPIKKKCERYTSKIWDFSGISLQLENNIVSKTLVYTVCRCTRIKTRNGRVIGFTSIDRDLVIDGVIYHASLGNDNTSVSTKINLGADDVDVKSFIDSDLIDEGDIHAGIYDGAEVCVAIVDYTSLPSTLEGGTVLIKGVVGEISNTQSTFSFEVRSRSTLLNQALSIKTSPICPYTFGDSKCQYNLVANGLLQERTLTIAHAVNAIQINLGSSVNPNFKSGSLEILTGDGKNKIYGISAVSGSVVTLSTNLTYPLVVGDRVRIKGGCSKTTDACKAYSNFLNFGGFVVNGNFMPGADKVLSGQTDKE